MAKKKREDGAFRVGVVSEWKKPEKDTAPRRCKVGSEWVKVWPNKTVGWKEKQPIKAVNESLAILGKAAIEGQTAFVGGYEELDDYGVTFYAETAVVPAPADAAPRYLLSKDDTPKQSGDFGSVVEALNANTLVNAHAAAVDLAKVDWEAGLDFLRKMTRPAQTPANTPEEEPQTAPEVEF